MSDLSEAMLAAQTAWDPEDDSHDAVTAAVLAAAPIIRADAAEAIAQAIRRYADLLAANPGALPAIDVAWKLRQILADPNVGIPDAPVTNSAPVRLHNTEIQQAKRRLFARIVASAHLLDQPFTDAPHDSPWDKLKRDMAALDAAIARGYTHTGQDPADRKDQK